ncbi:MAG: PepSY domain-containing protein [Sphingopyxis sp.]|uniref:PepSY domain-containing protein n=1 Tax=Sphingopyxis sp. TaxID=1908224 RepID=UPI001A29D81D|nr:PepSY domain-containing protein [Sphingopyxis sp.]MBJ7498297.1 PepSY domain-containing protein [Sphingopyxis sp.]
MKPNIPFMILALACGAAATVAIAAAPAPEGAANDPFWSQVHWDDDDNDDFRQRAATPMPVPDTDAVRRAGMTVVHEVERDDGLIEVEGLDADGRELDIKMDAQGLRVISIRHDD